MPKIDDHKYRSWILPARSGEKVFIERPRTRMESASLMSKLAQASVNWEPRSAVCSDMSKRREQRLNWMDSAGFDDHGATQRD
jgi:hypothetical protein